MFGRKKKSARYDIIIIGPQGSGKGTQADTLSKELKIPHISTGDIFREMKKLNTSLGKKVKSLIDKGTLVPDSITNQVVDLRLQKKDVARGFILDGYPRDLVQAAYLEGVMKVTHCILLDVSDKESEKRIESRRICVNCHAGYNLISIKPKKAGVCDKCSGKLVMREDDKPVFVRKRLQRYHSETKSVIGFYSKKGVLIHVNGEQSIKEVYSEMIKKIREFDRYSLK